MLEIDLFLHPVQKIQAHFGVELGQAVQADVSFLLILVMAIEAVLVQQCFGFTRNAEAGATPLFVRGRRQSGVPGVQDCREGRSDPSVSSDLHFGVIPFAGGIGGAPKLWLKANVPVISLKFFPCYTGDGCGWVGCRGDVALLGRRNSS